LKNPSFEDVQEARKNFLDIYHKYWSENALFTWQWWFLLITVVLSWIVWWKVVDKQRIHLIFNFGCLIAIISFVLDMIGLNHGAWAYPIRLYWACIPPLIPYDLTYIPVVFMLIYQRYGNNTKKAFLAFTITSAIISFIVEPFFIWIGVYRLYWWKHSYSFPIYIVIAFFVRFLVGIFEKHKKS
jgi:hypothetical protein